jgi:hypothetical protein
MHALKSSDNFVVNPDDKPVDPPPEHDIYDTLLIHAAKSNGKPIPSGGICCFMSILLKFNTTLLSLILSQKLSLIDQGATGCVAGEDARDIFGTNHSADIKGIDNHHVNNYVSVQFAVLLTPKDALSLPL